MPERLIFYYTFMADHSYDQRYSLERSCDSCPLVPGLSVILESGAVYHKLYWVIEYL